MKWVKGLATDLVVAAVVDLLVLVAALAVVQLVLLLFVKGTQSCCI